MSPALYNSHLYDEKTFYQTFLKDLENCQNEVIIESPYITSERMRTFDRIFKKLLEKILIGIIVIKNLYNKKISGGQ